MAQTVDRAVKPGVLARWSQQEDINFLLTNRVPRLALTRLMGRISRIRSPWLTRAAIALWRRFTELDLSDAKQQRFASIHACFTRELREGARVVDARADILASPCDAIVGACGRVERGQVFQAKGMPYALADLFGPTQDPAAFEGGLFVTLRLTSAMYHRFHAPHDLTVEHVTYFSGDTWNVNPIALQRIERLFCRNERALLRARLTASAHPIALVPVAAILVASLCLHFLPGVPYPRQRGASQTRCDAPHAKGQEMGWFEHGSTILLFVPPGFTLVEGVGPGTRVRMGQALLRLPPAPGSRY
jgi:phosphatidylserine decarboxylase